MTTQAKPIPTVSRPCPQALVSIVLPTYNRADRLPRALQSCLRQAYRNLEVIVVDDGSTDRTPEVVAAVQREDPRVRYFRQENEKLPAALNAGFRISRGEYLTWTSDDNQYDEDAIEIMVNALNQNPDIGFVYCGCRLVDDGGRFLRPYRVKGPEHLSEYNCIGACFMYRRRVYEVVGDYDPKWLLAEDYDYWLRVHQRFKMLYIPDVTLYSYGWHEESLTLRHNSEQCLVAIRLRVKHTHPWNKKLRLFASTQHEAAKLYARMGDWRRAMLAAFLHAACEPWRRWKWIALFQMFRDAMAARRDSVNMVA